MSVRDQTLLEVGLDGGPTSLPILDLAAGLVCAGLCPSGMLEVSGPRENGPEILSSHPETTSEGDAEEGVCTPLSMGQPQTKTWVFSPLSVPATISLTIPASIALSIPASIPLSVPASIPYGIHSSLHFSAHISQCHPVCPSHPYPVHPNQHHPVHPSRHHRLSQSALLCLYQPALP